MVLHVYLWIWQTHTYLEEMGKRWYSSADKHNLLYKSVAAYPESSHMSGRLLYNKMPQSKHYIYQKAAFPWL